MNGPMMQMMDIQGQGINLAALVGYDSRDYLTARQAWTDRFAGSLIDKQEDIEKAMNTLPERSITVYLAGGVEMELENESADAFMQWLDQALGRNKVQPVGAVPGLHVQPNRR